MTNPKFTRRTFNAGAALALLLPKAVWAQPRPAPNTRTLNFLVDPEPTSLVAITDTGVGTNLVTSKTTEGLFNYTNDFAQIPSLALSMATSTACLHRQERLGEKETSAWSAVVVGQTVARSDQADSFSLLRATVQSNLPWVSA